MESEPWYWELLWTFLQFLIRGVNYVLHARSLASIYTSRYISYVHTSCDSLVTVRMMINNLIA
jgi:hypothetical protein